MLSTVRKHILFLTVLILSLINAGIIFIAAAVSASDDAPSVSPAPGPAVIRTNTRPPVTYTVRGDETVFDIAATLGIPYYDLILENRLTGEAGLSANMNLSVPVFTTAAAKGTAQSRPEVKSDQQRGTAPLIVSLSASFADPVPSVRFFWDLGNNRFAFTPSVRARYTRPGVYRPRLVTVDESGRYAFFEPPAVVVEDISAAYQGHPYLIVERIGDLINVAGRLKNKAGEPVSFDRSGSIVQQPALVEYFADDTLIARTGGFSRVRLESRDGVFEFYLFVSPLPARLSVEPEFDWYKTQFDTGMYGNCGPASIGSAIRWATGTDLSVEKIREEIGMPYANGAVDYDNLLQNLSRHAAPSEKRPLRGQRDVLDVIDEGGLAIVSFNCGRLRLTDRDETTDFFDRYYPDATGHYLLIKGYTLDREYFIVYDAIPGEWKDNATRYPDGVSMIGRNRFFRIDEVMSGISQKNLIAVYRRPPGR